MQQETAAELKAKSGGIRGALVAVVALLALVAAALLSISAGTATAQGATPTPPPVTPTNPPPPTVRHAINFSDPATAAPSGWEIDSGDPYGLRSNALTYGWIDSTTLAPVDLTAYGRNRSPVPDTDVLHETLMHMAHPSASAPEGIWEIDVPNGDYQVLVQVGDNSTEGVSGTRHIIRAEGVVAVDFPQQTGGYGTRNGTAVVTVTDGKLTLDSVGGSNTKIMLVVIESDDGLVTPAVLDSTPIDGERNVPVTTGLSANFLKLPNPSASGATSLDNATITTANVQLFEVTAGGEILVPSSVNGTGGGDAINLTPSAPLNALTKYRFSIQGVADLAGAQILPQSIEFETDQNLLVPTSLDTVAFTNQGPVDTGNRFTTLTMGPDGRLYGLALGGNIHRFDIQPDGTLANRTVLTGITSAYGGRLAIGLEFAPDSTPGNLVAYVSHSSLVFNNGPAWDGKLSRLTGSDLENEELLITGLPRSVRDHLTNSIEFNEADPNVLYFPQGSNSAGGAPDGAWGNRPERLLSGALLSLDLSKLTSTPLDVRTSDDPAVINAADPNSPTLSDGTYNPYYTGAPLTMYATGVRNSYDMVWHSNGQLYVPANGTAGGSLTPASIPGTLRPDGTLYSGPAVPAVGPNESQRDWMFRMDPANPGGYYGHPNPLRGEFVMNRGKTDADFYPASVVPDANYRGVAFDFDFNKSPNGIIEYRSNAHNGKLQGALLVTRYSAGSDIIALLPDGPNGDIATAKIGIPGIDSMVDPLDIIEDPRNGNLYISDFGTSEIILVTPTVPGTAAGIAVENLTKMPFNTVSSTNISFPADDYYTFSKVRDVTFHKSYDQNTMRISNTGVEPLVIDAITISDATHFALPNGEDQNLPITIAPGASYDLDVAFVENVGSKGNRVERLELHSNAANDPIYTATLNGLYAVTFEGGNEPTAQQIMNAFGFTTSMAGVDRPSSDYPLPHDVASGVHGDLVVSELWEVADPNEPVRGIRLASYEGQFNASARLMEASTFGTVGGYSHIFDVDGTQMLLPPSAASPTTIDGDTTTTATGQFRITTGAYHTSGRGPIDPVTGLPETLGIRIYQAYDRNGDIIDHAYIVLQDYVGDGCTTASGQCDWNDGVLYFTNIKPVSPPPTPCGNLSQEAEAALLTGTLATATDAAASGGTYIGAPAGLPNIYTPDTANGAEWCVYIPTAGDYRIDASVIAPAANADSWWVQVDNGPVAAWHIGTTPTWTVDSQSTLGGSDPTLHNLTAGQHTIRFFQRESGTQLDTIELVPMVTPSGPPVPAVCAGLSQEAEAGSVTGTVSTATDATASGGSYVGTPASLPNSYTVDLANYAEWCFNVATAGDYRIDASVIAPAANADSWWVEVDGGPITPWHVATSTTWTTDSHATLGVSDPTLHTLTAGQHVVRFYQRESGAQLDTIELVPVGAAGPNPAPGGPWNQAGADIDGASAGDQAGFAVGLSADGNTVVVGAPKSDATGTDAGSARVFELSGSSWVQVGGDIDGAAPGDEFGRAVAISDDGTRIIIGGRNNDAAGSNAGHAQVYELTGGAWVQVGADLVGEAAGDAAGFSVAMSADGNTVIVGALGNDGTGADAGHARVYELSGATWIQVGADIDGSAAGDQAGFSVAISADASTVALGSPRNDAAGTDSGQARVFELSGGSWVQVGSSLDGEAAGDRFGYSVALSATGDDIIIGGRDNDGNGARSGHARIYKLSGGTWSQVGADIDGEAAEDRSGYLVAMAADGQTVAVGALFNDGAGNLSGHTRLFTNNGGWTQVGADIDGDAAGDRAGAGVALSDDGLAVAVGAPLNDDAGVDAGHARVYRSSGNNNVPAVLACSFDPATGDVTWNDMQQTKYWVYQSTDGGATYIWIGRTLGTTTLTVPNPVAGALYQVHYQGIPRVNCT